MMAQDQGGFSATEQDGGTAFHIRPSRPPSAFLMAAILLAGLFGLPALAVLLVPGRWDWTSLGAAACGLAITAGALLVLRRVLRQRRPVELVADAAGLCWNNGTMRWDMLADIRVQRPEPPRDQAPGIHALAAGIAAQHLSRQARLVLERRDGQPGMVIPAPLGEASAEALRLALLQRRPLPGAGTSDVRTSPAQ